MVLREPKPHPFAVATPATTPRAESVDKVVHAAVPDGGYHRAFEVAPQPFEKIEAGTVWRCPLDRQVRPGRPPRTPAPLWWGESARCHIPAGACARHTSAVTPPRRSATPRRIWCQHSYRSGGRFGTPPRPRPPSSRFCRAWAPGAVGRPGPTCGSGRASEGLPFPPERSHGLSLLGQGFFSGPATPGAPVQRPLHPVCPAACAWDGGTKIPLDAGDAPVAPH
jgi:hypothetical protein